MFLVLLLRLVLENHVQPHLLRDQIVWFMERFSLVSCFENFVVNLVSRMIVILGMISFYFGWWIFVMLMNSIKKSCLE
jgi:hypothetical protein